MAQQGSNPSHRSGGSRDERESGQWDDDERSRQNQHGGSDGGAEQQSGFSRGGRQMGDASTGSERNDGGGFDSQDRFASISHWGIGTEWHLDDTDAEWRRDRYRKFSDEFDTLRRDRAARFDGAAGGSDRSAAGSTRVTGTRVTGSDVSESSGPDDPAPGQSSGGVDPLDTDSASPRGKSR